MEKVILIIIAAVLFFEMIGAEGEQNKRTYCYSFIACVAAVTVIEMLDKILEYVRLLEV